MLQSSVPLSRTYNSLRTVFEADSQLEKIGRNVVIESLLSVIRGHGLERHAGVVLLHKHTEIEEHEIMLEDLAFDADGPALITRPRAIRSITKPSRPNSWQLCETGFVPCEFSAEHLLSSSAIDPEQKKAFFDEFGEALRDLKAASVLGVTVEVSNLVQRLSPAEDALLLESTALDERANVLRYVAADTVDFTQIVETAWFTDLPKSTAQKKRKTPKKRKPQGCRRICPRFIHDGKPVHQGTFIHRPT